MVGWLQIANKNKSRFNTEKIPVVDINARLDQLDEKVNKRYAELKADIDKKNNELIGLKTGLEQGISTLQEEKKKTQETLNTILARLLLHTSIPPPSYNLDPFNTPPPNTPKSPGQHKFTQIRW